MSHRSIESEHAGLLISLLVRYPEILRIIYDPGNNKIFFTFGININMEKMFFSKLKHRLLEHIETLLIMINRKAQTIEIDGNFMDDFCLLEYKRDIKTFEKSELNLLISLLKSEIKDKLLVEDLENIDEEMQWLHEEMINNFLLNLEGTTNFDVPLVAFREKGKVLVFNKN